MYGVIIEKHIKVTKRDKLILSKLEDNFIP